MGERRLACPGRGWTRDDVGGNRDRGEDERGRDKEREREREKKGAVEEGSVESRKVSTTYCRPPRFSWAWNFVLRRITKTVIMSGGW